MTDLLLLIVMVVGFVFPVRSPLQWLNVHPEFVIAVSVTMVPYGYVVWSGFLFTVPFPSIFIVSV